LLRATTVLFVFERIGKVGGQFLLAAHFAERSKRRTMSNKKSYLSRRQLLKLAGISAAGATLAACGGAAPAATNAPKADVAPTTAPAASAATATSAPAAAGAAPTPPPAPTITPVPMIPQPEGSLKLTFWYGLGGNLGNVVRQTVNKFNQSQKQYYVEAVFQASYDDTINKINTALAGGELPNIAQVFDAGTQRMIDSKRIIPVQDLLERDGNAKAFMDDLEPAVRSYYTVAGKMYSMPFNSSTAMTYFNRKMIADAGLDASKQIWTYDELLDAAAKTTKKDGDKIAVAGIAFNPSSWFFEQQMAVHKALMGEPENGRKERASKYAFNNETGQKWLEMLKASLDAGSGVNYASGNPQAAFVSGQAAFHFDSIASLRGIAASAEKNGIDVGVAFMPRRAGAQTGRTIIGGASLWLPETGTPEQQAGAWAFLKFATQTDTQGWWSANTGYYPVTRSSYDTADMKEGLKKYPQFQVAIDQIRSAPEDVFNSGVISGTFVPMRQEVQKAMDAFWSGKTASVSDALDAALTKANEQLEEYNATVKA
jgi:sn-glycerol 3-phosphate transport system substrate-binding protein